MKFDLYNIKSIDGKYEVFDLDINGTMCAKNGISIEALIDKLYFYCTNKPNTHLVWEDWVDKEENSSLLYFYDKDEYTITYITTVEYPDIDKFFKHFLEDIKLLHPELLL